ncbi:MAG: hypothetical protein RRA15_11635 [bacterium]|nr:hypothetical protein [bacterium]MDT8367117.1 hypothetical protein [bacterium]
MSEQDKDRLLLYYRTLEQMKAYRKVPVEQKFAWLQMQMEFYHECMSEKAKRFRDRFNNGKIKG